MRAWVIGLAFLSGVACGCSNRDHADLTGEVILDDTPLNHGSILLIPVDTAKGTAAGGEITDGRFSLTGKQAPRIGAYRVDIRAPKKSGREVQKAMGKPGEREEEIVEAVAPRFNSATELRVEVKPGGTTAKFAVSSK
jgi:hypothetical protein